jgi:hypothetical protein
MLAVRGPSLDGLTRDPGARRGPSLAGISAR